MAITEANEIDAMSINPEAPHTLGMLISDHLDWVDEYEHLMLLQEKVNMYLSFIESKNFAEYHPAACITRFEITIAFRLVPTKACLDFLEISNSKLNQFSIYLMSTVISDTDE